MSPSSTRSTVSLSVLISLNPSISECLVVPEAETSLVGSCFLLLQWLFNMYSARYPKKCLGTAHTSVLRPGFPTKDIKCWNERFRVHKVFAVVDVTKHIFLFSKFSGVFLLFCQKQQPFIESRQYFKQ